MMGLNMQNNISNHMSKLAYSSLLQLIQCKASTPTKPLNLSNKYSKLDLNISRLIIYHITSNPIAIPNSIHHEI